MSEKSNYFIREKSKRSEDYDKFPEINWSEIQTSCSTDSLRTSFLEIIRIFSDMVEKRDVVSEKVSSLKDRYNELVKQNNKPMFLFCLESLFFQYKILNLEMENYHKSSSLIQNRIYADYYKLYNMIVLQCKENNINLYSGLGCPRASYQERDIHLSGLMPRIEVNIGHSQKIEGNENMSESGKTLSVGETMPSFPVYKDIDPFLKYRIEDITSIHEYILKILDVINELSESKTEIIKNHRNDLSVGFSLRIFIKTLEYENLLLQNQIHLFIEYVQNYHFSQRTYLEKLSKKIVDFTKELDENILIPNQILPTALHPSELVVGFRENPDQFVDQQLQLSSDSSTNESRERSSLHLVELSNNSGLLRSREATSRLVPPVSDRSSLLEPKTQAMDKYFQYYDRLPDDDKEIEQSTILEFCENDDDKIVNYHQLIESSDDYGQGSSGTQQLTQKGASHPDEFGQRADLSTTNSDSSMNDQMSSDKFGVFLEGSQEYETNTIDQEMMQVDRPIILESFELRSQDSEDFISATDPIKSSIITDDGIQTPVPKTASNNVPYKQGQVKPSKKHEGINGNKTGIKSVVKNQAFVHKGQGSIGTQQLTQKGTSHPDEFGQRAKLSTTNFEDDQRSSEKFGNTKNKITKQNTDKNTCKKNTNAQVVKYSQISINSNLCHSHPFVDESREQNSKDSSNIAIQSTQCCVDEEIQKEMVFVDKFTNTDESIAMIEDIKSSELVRERSSQQLTSNMAKDYRISLDDTLLGTESIELPLLNNSGLRPSLLEDFISATAPIKSSDESSDQGSQGTQQLTQKGASHPDEFGTLYTLIPPETDDVFLEQKSSESIIDVLERSTTDSDNNSNQVDSLPDPDNYDDGSFEEASH